MGTATRLQMGTAAPMPSSLSGRSHHVTLVPSAGGPTADCRIALRRWLADRDRYCGGVGRTPLRVLAAQDQRMRAADPGRSSSFAAIVGMRVPRRRRRLITMIATVPMMEGANHGITESAGE
jgi:hypothetical protein